MLEGLSPKDAAVGKLVEGKHDDVLPSITLRVALHGTKRLAVDPDNFRWLGGTCNDFDEQGLPALKGGL